MTPNVKYMYVRLVANILRMKPPAEMRDPRIVTSLHPQRFVSALAIGPENKITIC